MNIKLYEKFGKRFYGIIVICIILYCSSALANEISIAPNLQVDACDATDTLWLYFDGEISGVEAASFTLGYNSSVVSITDVIAGTGLGSNGQIYWSDYPADDSILITVAVLVGDFDGPGNFIGVVLSADAEISSTSVTFLRTDLRDALNQTISHSTSSGAALQIDCTPPVVTCPDNITQGNDAGVCNAVVTYTPTAIDNFTITPSIVSNPVSGSTFPIGTTPVEVITTDDAGNADTCTFNVIIEDNEDPTIICIAPPMRNTDAGQCYYTIVGTEFDPTSTGDNCGIASVVNDFNAGATLAGAQITDGTVITWTITDDNSNTAQCNYTVTVIDNEAPTISCIAPPTRNTDVGQCYYTVVGTEFDPTSTGDNCGIASVSNDFNAGATLAGAQIMDGTVITWTITDDNSNTAQCNYTVTVIDNEAPTISCIAPPTRNTDVGQCYYTVVGTEFDPTSTGDNCGIASVVNDFNAGVTLAGAQITDGTVITWTITDDNSNTAQCNYTVTVIDNEDPAITCPPNVPAASCTETDPLYTGTATATDNCDPDPVITYTDLQADNIITRTWFATDVAANSSSCSQIITVDDYSVPTMQTIIEPEGEYYSTAPVFSNFGFQDDCDLNDGYYQMDGYEEGGWEDVNEGLTNLYVRALAISPSGDIFAGTYNSGGSVFRSTDNGDNWVEVNNGLSGYQVFSLDVNNSGDIFAGTFGGGIFRTVDNGESWTAINSGLTNLYVNAIAANASDDIFAVTSGGGVFRSTDNGDNWVAVNNGLTSNHIRAIAINTSGDIFVGTSSDGIFRSTNNGDTWSVVNNGLTNKFIRSFAINGSGDIFVGTDNGGIFRSSNNGNSWAGINNGLTSDHIYALIINTSGVIYAGTQWGGGVFRSMDNGNSWMLINNGPEDINIWSLAINSAGEVFAGTWGSGIFRLLDNGFGWISIFTDVSGTTWNDNGWSLPGFESLSEGNHTIYFKVDDDFNNVNGNGGEISWQFYKDIDTDPPVISLNSPGDGETTANHFMQLSTTVNDESPPMSVWIYGGTASNPQTLLLADTNVGDGATITFDWNAQRLTSGTGTMGLWHFDNYGSSTVYDSSGNTNNGSFLGNASWTRDSRFGYAVEFDGSGCALSIPDNVSGSLDVDSLEGALTVEAWIYPDTSQDNDYHTIVGKRASTGGPINYQVSLDKFTGNLLFYSGHWPQVFISSIYVPLKTWSYIAVTVDVTSGVGDAIFYLNGVAGDTISGTVVFGYPNDGPLLIGVNNATLTEEFDGKMDEIRLTNRALNPSEIEANYELGAGDYFWRVVAEDSLGISATSSTWTFSVAGGSDCIPGEANGIDPINIFDITYLISYLYLEGPAPTPYERCSGDPNCDCSVNIFDITYLIKFLYLEGPAPCNGQNWIDACTAN